MLGGRVVFLEGQTSLYGNGATPQRPNFWDLVYHHHLLLLLLQSLLGHRPFD